MADKDYDPSAGSGTGDDQVPEPVESPGDEESEAPRAEQADVSDPEAQGEEELTVDDILNAAQSDEATTADAEDGEHADLLIDLKRVTAEYANYRRRTEALRQLEIERAQGRV